LTPQSGISSAAAATNSFPYLFANIIWTCISSGRSAHLGAAKQILDIASFRSIGHSLKHEKQHKSILVTSRGTYADLHILVQQNRYWILHYCFRLHSIKILPPFLKYCRWVVQPATIFKKPREYVYRETNQEYNNAEDTRMLILSPCWEWFGSKVLIATYCLKRMLYPMMLQARP
jgi:hypothetical protein